MKILEVKNLSKIYGKGETRVRALDNVSFSVNKGEFVAIVGPSGSGKSTLLHILGGVDVPTSGSVIINGEDISQLDETALAIFRRRQTLPARLSAEHRVMMVLVIRATNSLKCQTYPS